MNQISLLKQAPLEVAQLLSTNNILCGLLVDDTKEPQPQTVNVKQLISEKYLKHEKDAHTGKPACHPFFYFFFFLSMLKLKR